MYEVLVKCTVNFYVEHVVTSREFLVVSWETNHPSGL